MFLLKIPESNFSIFLFFLGGGGGEGAQIRGRFGLKTSIDFAYRVWFSRELWKCMNVFIISVSND